MCWRLFWEIQDIGVLRSRDSPLGYLVQNKPWQKSIGAPVSGGFLADANYWQLTIRGRAQAMTGTSVSSSGTQVAEKCLSAVSLCWAQSTAGRAWEASSAVGRKAPIWSRIVPVPSVSLAALESGKVLGSYLAHLGGNMASPPDSAHSISAEN